MISFFVVIVSIGESQFKCSPEYYATCQKLYTITPMTYEQYEAADKSSMSCVLCNPTNSCNGSIPDSGAYCYPHTKSCLVCGTISNTYNVIGRDYSLTIAKSCTSNLPCPNNPTTTFQTGVVFTNGVSNMIIKGQTNMEELVVRSCPAFTFEGTITSVSISSLTITCQSGITSALLFQYSSNMKINIANVLTKGWILSGVLLSGGDFRTSQIPPILSTTISESVFSNISVSQSVFRKFQAITLAQFNGDGIDLSGLARFTRLAIQQKGVATFKFSTLYPKGGLIILNISEYTDNIEGPDYEAAYYHKDAEGFDTVENEYENQELVHYGLLVIVIMCVMIGVTHQDIFYWKFYKPG